MLRTKRTYDPPARGDGRWILVERLWPRSSLTLSASVGARKTDGARGTLYTIGHSTRSTRELVDLLRAHRAERVVDVRTIPKSRHNPQFNRPALTSSLHLAKIGYRHMKALGGLRHARLDSVNLGWRNASFRGYADYMQSEDVVAGLARLEQLAARRLTAIMCAEALPWRCHRSLIADALTVARWRVLHIQSRQTMQLHKRMPSLRVRSGRLLYPAQRDLHDRRVPPARLGLLTGSASRGTYSAPRASCPDASPH